LIWAAPAVLLHPFQNTPFIDDWVYSWSVQRLLEHGDLRVLDYSGNLNFVQILWGTLFCLPLGFSFTALRLSTWVCAAACLWGITPRDAQLLQQQIGVTAAGWEDPEAFISSSEIYLRINTGPHVGRRLRNESSSLQSW
jgi:hypothetical protein